MLTSILANGVMRLKEKINFKKKVEVKKQNRKLSRFWNESYFESNM